MFGIFNKSQKKFIAHCLDPMQGYHTKEITPNSEDDAERLSQFAEGGNLYFITYYEDGEPVEQMVPASQKQIWLNLKKTDF
jgi:hypothetical protein